MPRFEEMGPLDGLAQGLVTLGLGFLLAGIGLRASAERALMRVWRRTAPLHAGEAHLLRLVDWALAGVAGLCAGLALALGAALLLRGAPGGLGLHLAVAGLALGLAGWVLWDLRGPVRPAGVRALLVLAGLAGLGGLAWPERIEARAARIEPGPPRCLRAGDRLAQAGETMLLTLPRGRPCAPGLILTVMAPDGPRHFRWSYRADRFVRYGAYRGGGCPG